MEEEKVPNCSVCIEPALRPSQPKQCAHWFCYDCLSEWAKVTNLCPNCKTEFNTICEYKGPKVISRSRVLKKKQVFTGEEILMQFADVCYVCTEGDNEEELLVCDICNWRVCHFKCDQLKSIPKGLWKCDECRVVKKKKKKRRWRRRPVEYNADGTIKKRKKRRRRRKK